MIIGDGIDSCQDIVEISLEQRRHVGLKALLKGSIGPWWRPSALTIPLARSFSELARFAHSICLPDGLPSDTEE